MKKKKTVTIELIKDHAGRKKGETLELSKDLSILFVSEGLGKIVEEVEEKPKAKKVTKK
jgi:hypothetical protein